MALLHALSSESVNSGLDIFSLPPTQTSLETGQLVEHFPLAALTPAAPIEFIIRGSGEEYLDLSNTFLHIRAKITKSGGANLTSEDKAVPVNYWLHSLFSQVDVTLNDTLITPSQNTYPYRAYIESVLNYGRDAKKGHLTAALFYRDSSNYFDELTGENNTGVATRLQFCSQSKQIDMYGRLHTDIMTQERYMINGVDVKIRLTPSKHVFNIMGDASLNALSVITHASLFIRKVKLNPAVALAHAKGLEKTTAKYPLNRVVTKVFSVPKGQMSAVEDNLFLSQLPKRVVIGLVKSSGFLGDYGKNPFNFETFGLTYMALSIDGRHVPGKPLTPDFNNNLYARSFYNQCMGVGHHQENSGAYLEYRDFKLGYGLFVFDLTPSTLDGNQVELIRSGSLRLELKFSEALAQPIHVIIYGEADSIIEIDKSRQILTDFTL
ncbi:hypothetical protein ElyMa_001838200 [Elysia marginata]|uniref:Glycosyl hydrolase family 38 C-terminal domain-containing protein n=1 Tax=Elysia marginata TaxID=1093978 RepID=A0AAV4EJX0_9GAST|nr:hypothetical protein ElyMa_001838200 [Elysia marginata]